VVGEGSALTASQACSSCPGSEVAQVTPSGYEQTFPKNSGKEASHLQEHTRPNKSGLFRKGSAVSRAPRMLRPEPAQPRSDEPNPRRR
jgi:hypothetical protein